MHNSLRDNTKSTPIQPALCPKPIKEHNHNRPSFLFAPKLFRQCKQCYRWKHCKQYIVNSVNSENSVNSLNVVNNLTSVNDVKTVNSVKIVYSVNIINSEQTV